MTCLLVLPLRLQIYVLSQGIFVEIIILPGRFMYDDILCHSAVSYGGFIKGQCQRPPGAM